MVQKKNKEFAPTSWAINNKTSVFILALLLAIFGIVSYNQIPKEQFPEIIIPTFIVNTVYPGTSPTDIENLITRPLEKNIKAISGVRKISSNSIQDFSSVAVEFITGVEISDAKQKLKDAVDKTIPELPNDLIEDPMIIEINLSEIPIMYINISGNYSLDRLKKYADIMQDQIEALTEITRVDMVGELQREVQINIDMYRMQAAGLSFSDIERAVAMENMTISGGTINMHGMQRTVRVVGEFKDIETIKNIVINSTSHAWIYLKDVAEVKDTFKEQESFARLGGQNVITLNVIKKSGENLLDASDKIKTIIDDLKKNSYPSDLKITISGDMSRFTRTTLNDLNNTIVIGFILVVIVLMFFMGLTDAIFVGLAVPLSMALAYLVLPAIGFTMNMLVMFSFIFSLGIVVDDAIVVIENTHRIFNQRKMNIRDSAKAAAGEVFVPILSGTLTTLAPFFPLAFWPGITGKFMYFIPVTVIITLFASLIVAYIINPVFAVTFMKYDNGDEKTKKKKIFIRGFVIIIIGLLFDLLGVPFLGNIIIFIGFSYAAHRLSGERLLRKFRETVIPKGMAAYEKLLRWVLKGRRAYALLLALVLLFFFTIAITVVSKPKVVFFPDNEPSNIYVYIEMPVGTDVQVTDSVTHMVEKRVTEVLGENNPAVESILANVALGASDRMFDAGTITSNRGKVTVNFVEYVNRRGVSTTKYLENIRKAVKDIPGVEISVEKNQNGPPTGRPINIEVRSENLDELIATTDRFLDHMDSLKIRGAEEFKTDFEGNKPEVVIDIDRVRANNEGISTGQIGAAIRTAIYGSEVSKYRDGEDQFPIQLRFAEEQRKNIDKILNLSITFLDMSTGQMRQIPLSSVARIRYQNTYGGIKRLNSKRVITITSNVLAGYTANEIIQDIRKAIVSFEKPSSVEIEITGEQEDQKEAQDFLNIALLISVLLVFFTMIAQFNSISKPFIILSEIFFSIIGVLLGFTIFRIPFSIIMTGMGIVALSGIVIRNGILLVEFTDVLREKGLKTREAIIQAGKTRITPVFLTAITTIFGLIPLAIGFNINFVTLFSQLKPHIYFGGDNVMFFGSLAWSIIFGLTFSTFLTLVFIPVMYLIIHAGKLRLIRLYHRLSR
jgi:multidrug efflux pump subunit AcrB